METTFIGPISIGRRHPLQARGAFVYADLVGVQNTEAENSKSLVPSDAPDDRARVAATPLMAYESPTKKPRIRRYYSRVNVWFWGRNCQRFGSDV
jgi:hypothetical protein